MTSTPTVARVDRCTNGRCGPCHRAYCTPGGSLEPGHGFGAVPRCDLKTGDPLQRVPPPARHYV